MLSLGVLGLNVFFKVIDAVDKKVKYVYI